MTARAWDDSRPFQPPRQDAQERVRNSIVGTLIQQRNLLTNERAALLKSGERLKELEEELAHVNERLAAHGHVEKPPSDSAA